MFCIIEFVIEALRFRRYSLHTTAGTSSSFIHTNATNIS